MLITLYEENSGGFGPRDRVSAVVPSIPGMFAHTIASKGLTTLHIGLPALVQVISPLFFTWTK